MTNINKFQSPNICWGCENNEIHCFGANMDCSHDCPIDTWCMFCERPTKDNNAVCKRIWCRIKMKRAEIQYGRNKE